MQKAAERRRRATGPVSPTREPGLFRVKQTNGAELWLAMDESGNIIDSEKVWPHEDAGPAVERLGKIVYGDDVEAWDRTPLALMNAHASLCAAAGDLPSRSPSRRPESRAPLPPLVLVRAR